MSWFELSILFLIFYAIKIKRFDKGWSQLPKYVDPCQEAVSVVIAVRNEAQNIGHLLEDLQAQSHPNFEVIIVDDHSSDDTKNIVRLHPKARLLSADKEGKKAALTQGIEAAQKALILTTDADCRLHPDWIRQMTAPFTQDRICLVAGPVAFHNEQTHFEKAQSLEFLSLIVSGAGAIGAQHAFMCNGANMAFRKSIYASVDSDKASGDDVFLLHHAKRNDLGIAFVKEQRAIVYTNPKASFEQLFQQRKRWAAKSSAYKDKDAQYVSYLVFLTNLSLMCLLLTGSWQGILIAFLIKAITDYPFLKKGLQFFKKKAILPYFYPLQIIYPFYIVWVAVASQVGGFKWKERNYKK